MADNREFRIMVATDGSRHAEAAIATTAQFPWPQQTRVRAISAGRIRVGSGRSLLLTTLDPSAAKAADRATRLLALLGRLVAPPDGRVTLVRAVELMTAATRRLTPGAAALARGVRRMNTTRARQAMKGLDCAAAELTRIGWHTRTSLVHGEPLRGLLGAVTAARAELLVVGARGTSDVRQVRLGRVTEGALNRCPVAVLVAR